MRGLRVPIVIGLLFCVLWIVGSGAIAQPTTGPYPTTTGTLFASLSPPPSGDVTEPPSPSAPPSGDVTDPPSDPPTDPPSDPPPTGPPPPFTGADLTLFVVIGAALTGTGALFVRVARRRRSSEA